MNNSGASSRLSRLRECKEKLGLLKEIEENIDLLLHTSIDEENGALLSARIIANMERQIEAMNKNESDVAGLIIGRICPALQEQLATMKGSLVVYLSSVFEQLCEIGNENGGTLHTLMIVYEHPAVTAKVRSTFCYIGA
ncbi:unnamed protein product [Toxocara canis]|uniref:Uncharacterized protein n=1 Tax=Toxocara canis TaxID=6265 RepID=A0A183U8F1_TOXCA|nr:unnamed protein product [Toxocara canis]